VTAKTRPAAAPATITAPTFAISAHPPERNANYYWPCRGSWRDEFVAMLLDPASARHRRWIAHANPKEFALIKLGETRAEGYRGEEAAHGCEASIVGAPARLPGIFTTVDRQLRAAGVEAIVYIGTKAVHVLAPFAAPLTCMRIVDMWERRAGEVAKLNAILGDAVDAESFDGNHAPPFGWIDGQPHVAAHIAGRCIDTLEIPGRRKPTKEEAQVAAWRADAPAREARMREEVLRPQAKLRAACEAIAREAEAQRPIRAAWDRIFAAHQVRERAARMAGRPIDPWWCRGSLAAEQARLAALRATDANQRRKDRTAKKGVASA
jgi:hypothetical protein